MAVTNPGVHIQCTVAGRKPLRMFEPGLTWSDLCCGKITGMWRMDWKKKREGVPSWGCISLRRQASYRGPELRSFPVNAKRRKSPTPSQRRGNKVAGSSWRCWGERRNQTSPGTSLPTQKGKVGQKPQPSGSVVSKMGWNDGAAEQRQSSEKWPPKRLSNQYSQSVN